jgi:hypothetical protein
LANAGIAEAALALADLLAQLARIWAGNAGKATRFEVVAAELWRMATECQVRAAQLDSGRGSDIASVKKEVDSLFSAINQSNDTALAYLLAKYRDQVTYYGQDIVESVGARGSEVGL